MPEGSYTVSVTDACGRTAVRTFNVIPPEILQRVVTEAECGSTTGNLSVGLPGRTIATVSITAAPAAYTGPVPDDLSEFINPLGVFVLGNTPLGDYTFFITDTCGDTYTANVTLQPTGATGGVVVIPRPGCEEGKGSVRIYAEGNVDFTSVTIIAAPTAFTENLPYNISSSINQTGNTAGDVYVNSLPEGEYKMRFTDSCGFTQEQTITVTGFHVNSSEVTIIEHCGSFDIDLEYYSTGGYAQSFWLQKYDEATGTWGHPVTGVPYSSGLPDVSNAVPLIVNTVNINNPYVGRFRILKFFYTYGNGTSVNSRCMEPIEEFTFDGGPKIVDAYSFPCDNGLVEVALEVTGVPPFIYSITSKNGDTSFNIDNQGSSLFSGLEPANYNFQVTDSCGNVRNRDFLIREEDPILITPDGFCEGEYSTLTAPGLVSVTYKWYKQGNPGTVLSTAPMLEFTAYNSATQSGTYVLEIKAVNPQSCLNQTLTYNVAPNVIPNAGADGTDSLCNPFTALDLTTYLGTSFDTSGAWTDNDATGALTGGSFNTALVSAGTYHFTYTVNGLCNLMDTATITITLKDTPTAPSLPPIAGVCEGATVILGSLTLPGVSFSWTGPNGFTSIDQNPVLANITLAQAGDYYLTVSAFGCTSPPSKVTVTVSPLPYAGVDGTDTICNTGGNIMLSSYLGATYTTGGTWTDVDGAGSLTGEVFNTAGVSGGIYHFKYSVTNFCNVTDEAIVTLTLNTILAAPVLAPILPVCEGANVTLAAAGTIVPNAIYNWTGPNGFTSNQPNPVIVTASPAASGIYSLIVEVNGCPSPSATVSVVVNANPQFVIDGDAVLCDGQTGLLNVNASNFIGATYKWYLDDVLQPSATTGSVQISETGVYKVEVTTNTCTTTQEFLVSPNTNAFNVELEAGCENERYIIRVSNLDEIQDIASITWEGPDGFNAVGESADITNGATGIYTALITNTDGCSATGNVTVNNSHCFIPKGISPGDGQYNDNFDLSNLDVRHIKIFNRYGMQVYEKANYLNEWYGQSDKGDLPTGTYFYVITLSEGKQVTGWVYLLKRV
ncbi:gliding motility-associated C-terminal domain-containing protein [Flavobacterium psychrotrophum]|uniref:gliding motility-associated C-terminal domain-containing protein n=1 Tax=Flavobacterium psychrotrophum TaxID=2294119 RepID=UPI000E30DBEB|nr:gliding motility-associated C-terminal domain-containing protein [Flavobacterium psychrotrophum]